MVEKIIHYCWFGGKELPELAIKCIESWKKYCPDYEIRRWDESNFDIDSCDYVREAYNQKKWAFVSDYARFWILYNYGGLYFDTDVELIKPIDDLVEKGAFMGLERDVDFSSFNKDNGGEKIYANPGLGLYADRGLEFYADILEAYRGRHFLDVNGNEDKTTVVDIVSDFFRKDKIDIIDEATLKSKGIHLYRKDVFCPMDYRTGKMEITEQTRSIHHYVASWMSEDELRCQFIFRSMKEKYGNFFGRIIGYIITIPLRARISGILVALFPRLAK